MLTYCAGEGKGSIFRVDLPVSLCLKTEIPVDNCAKERAIEFPADLEILLVMPEGPTSRSIKLMCQHWQLQVVDMSFSGLLPQQSTMDQVWSRMKDDAGVTGEGLQSSAGAKQRHVVYVLDTSVFVALRRMAPSEQALLLVLSGLTGIIVGFVSDQAAIRRFLQLHACTNAAHVAQALPDKTAGLAAAENAATAVNTQRREHGGKEGIGRIDEAESEDSSRCSSENVLRRNWLMLARPVKYAALESKLHQCCANHSNHCATVNPQPQSHSQSAVVLQPVAAPKGEVLLSPVPQSPEEGRVGMTSSGARGGSRSEGGGNEVRKRILLVEDHLVNQKVAIRMIQKVLTYADICWRMLTYADVC
jgi:hypothetical protein